MAIKKEIWDNAKAMFEAGKSINFIAKELSISKSTVSTRAKQWDKGITEQLKDDIKGVEIANRTNEEKKRTITEQLQTLEDYQITTLHDLVEDETGIKSLVFSTANLALIRSNQQLTANKKTAMTKVKEYSNGQVSGETIELFEIPLEPKDIKDHIEAIDKASITLGVNQRHAATQINNTNANQTNNEKVIKVEYS